MRIRLTVDLDVDAKATQLKELRENLYYIVRHAHAEGWFTKDSDANVNKVMIIIEDDEGEHTYV